MFGCGGAIPIILARLRKMDTADRISLRLNRVKSLDFFTPLDIPQRCEHSMADNSAKNRIGLRLDPPNPTYICHSFGKVRQRLEKFSSTA